MYEIPEITKVFEFSELDSDIRDKIAYEMEARRFVDDFDELIHNSEFLYRFENDYDDINVQFSLNCCKGDGLNIYGSASYGTWYKAASQFLPYGTEIEPAENIIPAEIINVDYEHSENRRYCYSTWNMCGDIEDMAYQMAWDYIENQNPFDTKLSDDVTCPEDLDSELLARFERIATVIQEGMDKFCHDLEQMGYDEMEYYHTPEAHEDELYTEGGMFWGYTWDIPVITKQTKLEIAA